MTEVHYEVFRQSGRGGTWNLVEALPDRNAAVDLARGLLADKRAAAVRVVKETLLSGSSDYISLVVLEEGDVAVKKKGKKSEELNSPVPCFKPDDLYSYHARITLARLIGEWLARQRLTVTEFQHNAKALEIFEATGTTFQHAVQKVAVAQASDTNYPVQQIVKQLNDLGTAAIQRVFQDDKKGMFPELPRGEIGPFAAKLGDDSTGRYVMNGVLTKYLTPAANWDEKLRRLLDLMPEIPAEGPGRTLLLSCIDAIIGEMMVGAAALGDLLGKIRDLGHALHGLVELFLGATVELSEGAGGGINELARFYARDELPESRGAIAKRIVSELRSLKRLCPSSLDAELKTLRKLANRLVLGQGKYLSHEVLIGAFTERSKRLVAHEPLTQFMASAKAPDEKVERLLTVEENIIGAENKRSLSAFVIPLITSNGFEAQLLPGQPVQARLKRIAEIQHRVLRSGFQEVQKNQIALALDTVALGIEERAKFLAALEAKLPNPVERARTLLSLCLANVFTQGDLAMKARRALMASLARPGFLVAYMTQAQAGGGESFDRDKALMEFTGQLTSAGLQPEDLRRVLAA